MKPFFVLGFTAMVFSFLFFSAGCKYFPLGPQTPTPTPVPTLTAGTPTPIPTLTTGSPTPEISSCGSTPLNQFLDTFGGSSSLLNYSFFPFGSSVTTSAASLNYSVNPGELQEATTAGAAIHSYVMVNSAQFSHTLSNYTVEADFNLAHRTDNYGLFGVEFLEQPNVTGYIFQWNGNVEHGATPHWQIEKDPGSSGSSYTYLPPSGFGTGTATPVYTPGNWVHLKVVVSGGGTTFNCYVNLYDGNGDQLVFANATDTTGGTVFTSGGVGFRSEELVDPNLLQIRNYHAFTCP